MRCVINKIREKIRIYKRKRELKRKIKILKLRDPFIYK